MRPHSLFSISSTHTILTSTTSLLTVYYADVPVGSITCRFEPSLSSTPTSPPTPLKLHVLTLNVLPPYRSQGLGLHLLQHVLRKAGEWTPDVSAAGKTRAANEKKEKELERKVEKVMVYCQVGNEKAKAFYISKAGFEEKETCVLPSLLFSRPTPSLISSRSLPPLLLEKASPSTTSRSSLGRPSCWSAHPKSLPECSFRI